MERDGIISDDGKITGISTHTLTWSVTVQMEKLMRCVSISTHTLTWSVTGVFI